MVVTPDADLARRMRALRNHGRYDSDSWFEHAELGFNYRLSEMQCAMGLTQLARVDAILARREAVARCYCEHLGGNTNLVLPATDVRNQRLSWFVFVVRLAWTFSPTDRDRIYGDLVAAGIDTGRYFAPIHLQPAYAAWCSTTPLPVTESVAARTLALPFFNRITDEQIGQVCEALQSALRAQMQA